MSVISGECMHEGLCFALIACCQGQVSAISACEKGQQWVHALKLFERMRHEWDEILSFTMLSSVLVKKVKST